MKCGYVFGVCMAPVSAAFVTTKVESPVTCYRCDEHAEPFRESYLWQEIPFEPGVEIDL